MSKYEEGHHPGSEKYESGHGQQMQDFTVDAPHMAAEQEVLAYAMIGLWLVFVCQAIGEISTLLPLPGAFNAWGARVFDEAFSFQMT
ncbi:hypothetical protein BGZ89_002528, partial [Linnemannia elongata]